MASLKSASTKLYSPKLNESISNDFGKVNYSFTSSFSEKMINDILDKHDKESTLNSDQLANLLNRADFKQNFYSINFDLELCKLFISLINNPNNFERSDSIKFANVYDIYKLLNCYKDVFVQYDTSNNGLIEPHQLSMCITKLGFVLSPTTIKSIINHYCVPYYSASNFTPLLKENVDAHNNNNNNNNQNNFNEFDIHNQSFNNNEFKFNTDKRYKITFQQYVKCCTKLKALSDAFHERDLDQNRNAHNRCTFNYEEFIKLVMNL